MSLELFRVVHILGLLLLFCGLTAAWAARAGGGQPGVANRMFASLLHGIGLLILLVSGFGMLHLLGWGASLPVWAILKLAIWILLGGSLALAKRKPGWGVVLVSSWIVLGTAAAYLCIYKPV